MSLGGALLVVCISSKPSPAHSDADYKLVFFISVGGGGVRTMIHCQFPFLKCSLCCVAQPSVSSQIVVKSSKANTLLKLKVSGASQLQKTCLPVQRSLVCPAVAPNI